MSSALSSVCGQQLCGQQKVLTCPPPPPGSFRHTHCVPASYVVLHHGIAVSRQVVCPHNPHTTRINTTLSPLYLPPAPVPRFLAAKHDYLRPLGKCSLAELGLANGSLHLAAGPTNSGAPATNRPPPLSPGGGGHSAFQGGLGGGGGGGTGGGNSCWGGLPGTPPSHSHMPSIPSSPKPPLGRSSLDLDRGGGAAGGSGSILGSSPVGDAPILGLQRGGSGALAGSYNSNSAGGC
jgi:hypothetical protein